MKMSTVQVQYNTEKLRILRQYMPPTEELEGGMEKTLQALYEKHIPAQLREYIESRKKTS